MELGPLRVKAVPSLRRRGREEGIVAVPGVEAGAHVHREAGARIGAQLAQILLRQHLLHAVGRIGRDGLDDRAHLRAQAGV